MRNRFAYFVVVIFILASFSYADLSWPGLHKGQPADAIPALAGDGARNDQDAPKEIPPPQAPPAPTGQEINPDPLPTPPADEETGPRTTPPTAAGDEKITVPNPESILVLVNKQNFLPAEYVPPDLVKPDVPFVPGMDDEVQHMRRQAAAALEEMFAAAARDDLELLARSGYRSYRTQNIIFSRNVEQRGFAAANQVSAVPGESEHQTGLVMDVTSASAGMALNQNFAQTEEGRWIAAHAHKFGFIVRYPPDRQAETGYTYEPWHLRYVGVEAATAIYNQGLILEEYLAR